MSAEHTRMALATALRQQLAQMPLAKITVSGLCEAAGIKRQTFYYHFADVYALAVWVFRQEVADRILSNASYEEWSAGFCQMLEYLERNKVQTYAVVNSLSHRELEQFFFHALRPMMVAIVAQLTSDPGTSPGEQEDKPHLHPEDKDMVIDHYTLTILGHLFHWLANDMHIEPEAFVRQIEYILRGHVRHSITRLAATCR